MSNDQSQPDDDNDGSGKESSEDSSVVEQKVERVQDIIDTFDQGDPSLQQAQELRDEGEELLDDLREELDVGEGSVTEE